MPDIDTSQMESQDEYFGRTPAQPIQTVTPPVFPKTNKEHVVHVTQNEQEAIFLSENIRQQFMRRHEGVSFREISGSYVIEVTINNADDRTLQSIFDAIRFYTLGRNSVNHY